MENFIFCTVRMTHIFNCVKYIIYQIHLILSLGTHIYRGFIGNCEIARFTEKLECELNNSTWVSNRLTFTNIGEGMLTLFVISTMDNWFAFLRQMINTKGVSSTITIIYMVTYMMIMGFIMMNVFIGFIIVVFHMEKEKEEKFKVLNKVAQECILKVLTTRPPKKHTQPPYKFQKTVWEIVTATWFQTLSMVLIVLNTIILVTRSYGQDESITIMQKHFNVVFTIVFTIEILLKLIAFPPRVFMNDPWLMFDAIVVFCSWIDIALEVLDVSFLNLTLFRLFRVLRLVKIIGKGGNLRQLFHTFFKSLKCVPYIALLLALLLYLYAIVGMKVNYSFFIMHVRFKVSG